MKLQCGERLRLTALEEEAVAMVFQGMEASEIAEDVGLKASTIRSALWRAYRKLGVTSAGELIGQAWTKGGFYLWRT